MMTFVTLSSIARAMFALWALLLCLLGIGSTVLAAVRKRHHFAVAAILLTAPVYYMWQVIFDFSLFGGTEKIAPISSKLCGLPILIWFGALTAFTVASSILFVRNIQYDKNFVTPGAIKQYLDEVPCGVCCWRDSGRILLSNICINELCTAITGSPLLNGNQFCDAVKDEIITVNGQVWRFSCRDISLGNERLHEMIASDISTEYAKTQALRKDKEELSKLNRRLQEYYLSIDDTVRRQEILQAKINIHDEMNRLMLSTASANIGDIPVLNGIFSMWEKNALLLCMEAEEAAETKAMVDLKQLAKALKIRLIWQNELPDTLAKNQHQMFFTAAKEAIVNAVKHAGATTMNISFSENETNISCHFTNDIKSQPEAVKFTGGLRNLSVLAKKQGATISVACDKTFTLTLCFPNNSKNQPIG